MAYQKVASRTLKHIPTSCDASAIIVKKHSVAASIYTMRHLPFVLAFFTAVLAASAAVGTENPGPRLASLVREADSVVVAFYVPTGKEEVTFSDREWLGRLADVLEHSSYQPKDHCLCISYPQIRLYRGKDKTGMLSVHHGEKLRAYTNAVSGDFFVGAAVGKAIVDLAMEKKGLRND